MSRISAIESFVVPYTEPNDHGSTRYVCLIRMVDTDGIFGWGEAATLFKPATVATHSLAKAWSELLCGTPADPTAAADLLQRETWWYGNTGISSFARAAIDMALWDIRGKREGASLSEMLGRTHESLPVLLSCHATLADLRHGAALIADQVAQKHAIGVKVGFGKRGDAHLGYEVERDAEFVQRLREALGEQSEIMIDIGAALTWQLDDARDRLAAFADHRINWLEEPLGARHRDYPDLHHGSNTRIAFGEREWSAEGYAEIIQQGAVDVVGIDPGRAMGVTGFLDTTRMLETYGVEGNAHAFSGPVIFAASLALSLASPAFKQLELMPLRNSLYELAEAYPEPADGRVSACNAAGLGVELSLERVKAAAVPIA